MDPKRALQRLIAIAILASLGVVGCRQKGDDMADLSGQNTNPGQDPVPVEVTKELFLKWRTPRFGSKNPERMNNPVWEWLIKAGINAYTATERLDGPSAMDAGPGWCFDRFGQSSNQLPDGKVVFVAGEHEDSYDPDFHIYNDVVVRHPDGWVDIFGYPPDVFPPTDFHSATLTSNRLILIGSLGYPEQRRPGETPVFILDLKTFSVFAQKTSGTPPGWIHDHTATLSPDGRSILIQRGKLDRGGNDRSLVENIDDWRLHLGDWHWERLTERRWSRWEVRRKDGERNHLFDYQQAVWTKQFPELEQANSELARVKKQFEIPTLQEELGKAPDLDSFARLYQPPVSFEEVARSEPEAEYGVHRIQVAGVVVRYVADMMSIQITVEGDLPEQTLNVITRDLLDKLAKLENAPCELVRL